MKIFNKYENLSTLEVGDVLESKDGMLNKAVSDETEYAPCVECSMYSESDNCSMREIMCNYKKFHFEAPAE